MDEKKIAKKFGFYLKSKNLDRIWFKTNFLNKSQPDIDLIFGELENSKRIPPLYGAEIKYIRGNQCLSHSYYNGLEETLAILTYGIDNGILIHLFELSLFKTEIAFTYLKKITFLIKSIALPIGYQVYAVDINKSVEFFEQVSKPKVDLEIFWIQAPKNPLLLTTSNKTVHEFRRNLIKQLKIFEENDLE